MRQIKLPAFRSPRLMWRDRRGATAVTVGLFMTIIIGMAGFVVDLGHVMYVQRQLQASSDAAALAGARQINCCTTSIAATTATAYSSAWTNSSTKGSNKNASANLYVQMASGYPKLMCFKTTDVSCTGPDSSNGIIVQQTASVPMWFASIFGLSTINVSATSTAGGSGGTASSYDIDLVLDTTNSMTQNDSACGMTKIACALSGVRLLMSKLSSSADHIGLFAFPALSAVSEQATDNGCSGSPTTTGYLNLAGETTIPTTKTAPTYQIVPLSGDYQSSPGTLSTSSALSEAAGAKSGCSGLAAPGGWGTFYADAITAASTDLQTDGRTNVTKAIILLSDGDSNAPTCEETKTTGSGRNQVTTCVEPDMNSTEQPNQCAEGITAAENAAKAGIQVFVIAYASPTTGSCSTDTPTTSACATLTAMASDPSKFYSDDADGCKSSTQSITALISIFGSIANSFDAPRLLPNGTT